METNIFEDDDYLTEDVDDYIFGNEPEGLIDRQEYVLEIDEEKVVPTYVHEVEETSGNGGAQIHRLNNPWRELHDLGVEFHHTVDIGDNSQHRLLFRFDKYESKMYCKDNNIVEETISHPYNDIQRKTFAKYGSIRFKQKLGAHTKKLTDGTMICGYNKYILLPNEDGRFRSRQQDLSVVSDKNSF